MTRTLTVVVLTTLSFLWAQCVAFAAEPAFEVASITPCEPGTSAPEMEHTGITNFVSPGGRFRAHATTIEFLMEWAYGLQPSRHSKGPGWFGTDRFDIVAKADHDATENEEKLMVQTLSRRSLPAEIPSRIEGGCGVCGVGREVRAEIVSAKRR